MPTLTPSSMLGLAMRFVVEVDGLDLGGWQQCKGLTVEFKGDELEEGGNNDHWIFLPTRIKYQHITLVRAMNKADSGKVMGWLATKARDEKPGTARIVLYDAHGDEVAKWSLQGVYPLRWFGPALDAEGKGIALETLELFHEGFL